MRRRGLSPLPIAAAGALALALATGAGATWSIVIADADTREVAVGTVTCLDQFDLLALVPVVVVGRGGAAVQAAGDFNGVRRPIIFAELLQGTPPEEILEVLEGIIGHQDRQYGIADTLGGTLTFTGTETLAWAGGATGSSCSMFYAVQGNILAGGCVVPAIVEALLQTPGDVPAKLMAGMQAARMEGGDGRCSCSAGNPTGCGCPPPRFTKSGHIGGMVVARIGDADDRACNAGGCADGDYFMRLNVPFQDAGDPDPVEQLQAQFDAWRAGLAGRPDAVHSTVVLDPPSIPADGVSQTTMTVTLLDWQDGAVTVPVASLTVEHAPGSAGHSTIGPVKDNGDGTWDVTLTAGVAEGVDRFTVTADDSIRPVILMPEPVLEYCSSRCVLDCNGNGVPDICDIGNGLAQDCNRNLVPDECDIAAGKEGDCNLNGLPDGCEDCNGNGAADECDLADGTSSDVDENGVPDECHGILFVPGEHATIQSAIAAAQEGDTVLVSAGSYSGPGNRDLNFLGKAILVKGQAGPARCIIDCGGAGRGAQFLGGETPESVLEGFTITGGTATNGGAVFCDGSSPTVRRCVLTRNGASALGGAIYATGASPVVERCAIVGNTAGSRGGALHVVAGGTLLVRGCLMADNDGGNVGGAVSVSASNPTVEGCTIAGNGAASAGGAVYVTGLGETLLRDSVVWGDSAPSGAELFVSGTTATLTVTYTDVEGGEAGAGGNGTLNWLAGNLETDPLFADAASGNYRLAEGSPCVDAGDPAFAGAPGELDLDGRTRVADGDGDSLARVDMGAYERPACPADLDGDGAVAVTDLLEMLGDWGPCWGCPADVDGDGAVGVTDLIALLGAWGACG